MPAAHHRIVFTISKMLRAYFRYDRTLLSDLSRAAWRAAEQGAGGTDPLPAPFGVQCPSLQGHPGGGEGFPRARRPLQAREAPLMLSRITYDRDRATVRVEPQGSRARETTELDAYDFKSDTARRHDPRVDPVSPGRNPPLRADIPLAPARRWHLQEIEIPIIDLSEIQPRTHTPRLCTNDPKVTGIPQIRRDLSPLRPPNASPDACKRPQIAYIVHRLSSPAETYP